MGIVDFIGTTGPAPSGIRVVEEGGNLRVPVL